MKNLNDFKNITLMIEAPDSYLDIFQVYMHFFKKNWPDCPFKFVLINQSEHLDISGVEIHHAGQNADWKTRVKYGLSLLSTPYVLTMDVDQLIGEKINNNKLKELLLKVNNNIKYIRLYPPIKKIKYKYANSSNICYIDKKRRYGKDISCNIWLVKEYIKFMESLGDVSAWDAEEGWLKDVACAKKGFFDDSLIFTDNPLHIVHGVVRGCWLNKAIKFLKNNHYPVDEFDRPTISKKKEFIFDLKFVLSKIVPTSFIAKVKRFLSKFGFKFKTMY